MITVPRPRLDRDIFPDPLEGLVAELHQLAADVEADQARRWRRRPMLRCKAGAAPPTPRGDPDTRH